MTYGLFRCAHCADDPDDVPSSRMTVSRWSAGQAASAGQRDDLQRNGCRPHGIPR
jgi:hypothetical protein